MSELKRILYAEDEADIQIIVETIMQCIGGYEIKICNNGQELLDCVENYMPDLILLDVMMPIMDGFEATSEIRKIEDNDKSLGHTPIIAFTANTINNDREKCLQGGMDDMLEKPFDIKEFREKVTLLP